MTGLAHDVEMIRSFDGTLLAARPMGGSSGLPVLVVDGVGAKLSVWRGALHAVADDHPIYNWDLRGLFESGPPVNDRVDPTSQARDAIEVLDHFDVDRAVVVTWSSGGRIALQIGHDHPDRVAGLALVCAGYGRSLRRLLQLDPFAFLPRIAGVAKYAGSFLLAPLRGFVARPEVAGLIRQSGMVAATADTPALIELLRGIAESDPYVLLKSYEAISGDPGSDLLPDIDAPTLIVSGEKDQFTARDVIEEMYSRISDARLVTYEGATHFLPIEFPERLGTDLEAFFKELRP